MRAGPVDACRRRQFVPGPDGVSDSRAWVSVTDVSVIVTGAGRGLGRAHALEFARQGAKVVVNDLGVAQDGSDPSDTPAQQVVDEIVAAGGEAVTSPHDVSDWDAAGEMVQLADRHLRRARRGGQQRRHRARPHVRQLRAGRVGGGAAGARAGPRRTGPPRGRLLAGPKSKAGEAVDARIINTSSGAGLMGSIAQAAYSRGQGRHRQPDPGAGRRARPHRRDGQRARSRGAHPHDRGGLRRHDGRGRRGRLRRHGPGERVAAGGVARLGGVGRRHRPGVRGRGRHHRRRRGLPPRPPVRQGRPLGPRRDRSGGRRPAARGRPTPTPVYGAG